jgi:hypothetical protein
MTPTPRPPPHPTAPIPDSLHGLLQQRAGAGGAGASERASGVSRVRFDQSNGNGFDACLHHVSVQYVCNSSIKEKGFGLSDRARAGAAWRIG